MHGFIRGATIDKDILAWQYVLAKNGIYASSNRGGRIQGSCNYAICHHTLSFFVSCNPVEVQSARGRHGGTSSTLPAQQQATKQREMRRALDASVRNKSGAQRSGRMLFELRPR